MCICSQTAVFVFLFLLLFFQQLFFKVCRISPQHPTHNTLFATWIHISEKLKTTRRNVNYSGEELTQVKFWPFVKCIHLLQNWSQVTIRQSRLQSHPYQPCPLTISTIAFWLLLLMLESKAFWRNNSKKYCQSLNEKVWVYQLLVLWLPRNSRSVTIALCKKHSS